jgi:tetratricopeptide (TPR) repeat protein
LLAKAPNDGHRIFDHAQSVYWVGYAAWKRADGPVAEARFRDYLRLAEQLVQLDMRNPDWRAEVGFAHGNLGMVFMDTGRPREAVDALTKSVAVLVEVLKQRPELGFGLGQAYGWLSDAHALLGDYRLALQQHRKMFEIFDAVDPADRNAVAQRGLLSSLNQISRYELALGNAAEAELSSVKAVRMAAELLRTDADNQFWLSHACVAELRLVETQIAMGRAAAARKSLAHAEPLVKRFNATGIPGLSDEVRVNARRMVLASALAETPAQRRALIGEIQRFVEKSTPKIRSDVPDRIKLSVELANASLALSRLQQSFNDLDFRPALETAKQLLEPFSALSDGAVLTPLAEARLGLGDHRGAIALADKIFKSSYRHPEFADLSNRLHAVQGGGNSSPTSGTRK